MPDYPDLAKSKRKDALVPDPQEFDLSDPDRADRVGTADNPSLSATNRLEMFDRLLNEKPTVQPSFQQGTRRLLQRSS